MLRTRVIPVLTLEDGGLVKTRKFKDPVYVGDPINAVKIFNDKEVDELIFADMRATQKGKSPDFRFLREVASECFMPLCYAGAVKSVEDIRQIIGTGVEKVAINSAAWENPNFIQQAADRFGSSTVVVSVDVKKNLWGNYQVYTRGGTLNTKADPTEFAVRVEKLGAGEILLNSIDRDGTYQGYDFALIEKVCAAVSIPVIVCGGAAGVDDFVNAVKAGASACAAGSMFVFQGKHRAVLINFPTQQELRAKLP